MASRRLYLPSVALALVLLLGASPALGEHVPAYAGQFRPDTAMVPKRIAVAHDGSVYTGDLLTSSIRHFGAVGDAQFADPVGAAVAHDGSVYVADGNNWRIQYFRLPPAQPVLPNANPADGSTVYFSDVPADYPGYRWVSAGPFETDRLAVFVDGYREYDYYMPWEGGEGEPVVEVTGVGVFVHYYGYFGLGSHSLRVDELDPGTGNPIGTFGTARFTVVGLPPIPAEVVTISDASLQAAIRDKLGKPTGDLTEADMAKLTSLGEGSGLSGVESLSGLEYAVNLGYLGLDGGCSVADLTPIQNLTHLWGLDLMNNQVLSDITPLQNLAPRLTLLDLSHNQVRDIGALGGLPSGGYLDLLDNDVGDLSPLAGKSLQYLDIRSNRLDLTPGAEDMVAIEGLMRTVGELYYTPQKAPPVLDRIGAKSVAEGADLAFSLAASGDGALAFSATGLPAGASFDTMTAVFSWQPGYDQAGSYEVVFRLSDGFEEDVEAVTITVTDTNRPPVAVDDAASTSQGDSAIVDARANDSDPDGDALAIVSAGPPAHGNVTIASGQLHYTPVPGFYGSDVFPYTVSDGRGGTASARVVVTVAHVNHPPTADAGSDRSVEEATIVRLDGAGTDPDGDALTYVWTQTGGQVVTLSDPASATATFTAPAVLADTRLSFRLVVSDGSMAASDTVTLTVRNVAAPSATIHDRRWWLSHPREVWEILAKRPLDVGDIRVSTLRQAQRVLGDARSSDARDPLRGELLTALLNLASGADPFAAKTDIRFTVAEARRFLTTHVRPVKRGADMALAGKLTKRLKTYNETRPCGRQAHDMR